MTEQTQWWSEINDLALIEAARRYRQTPEQRERWNSHLVGAARVIGLPEDEIRKACESDRGLTIYEP